MFLNNIIKGFMTQPLISQVCLGFMIVAGSLALLFGTSEKVVFYDGTRLARFRDTGYRSVVATFLIAVHLAFIAAMTDVWNSTHAALFNYDIQAVVGIIGRISWGVLWWLLSGLGITASFHRIETHSGVKAPTWLRVILILLGQSAGQQSLAWWKVTHTWHHSHSDQPQDPHSRLWRYNQPITNWFLGWCQAHFLWLLMPLPPELGEKIKRHVEHEMKDLVVAKCTAVYALCVTTPTLLSYLVGGWPFVIWRLASMCVTYHATWSVNSVAHGPTVIEPRRDASRNIFGLLAFLSHGETIHGNHHDSSNTAVNEDPAVLRYDRTGRFLLWLERHKLVTIRYRLPAPS